MPSSNVGKPQQITSHPIPQIKKTENHAGRITLHVLRHSFASVANDLGFTESTIAALVGHSRSTITSRYIHTVDTALVMAADIVASYVQALLDGVKFKRTSYALDRDAHKAAMLPARSTR